MDSGTDKKENGEPKVAEPERKKHAGGRPPLGALFKPGEVLEYAEKLDEEMLIEEVPLVYLRTLFIALETAKASMRDATWQARFNISQRILDSLLDDKVVKAIGLLAAIRPEKNATKKAKKETGPAEPIKTTWKESTEKDEKAEK